MPVIRALERLRQEDYCRTFKPNRLNQTVRSCLKMKQSKMKPHKRSSFCTNLSSNWYRPRFLLPFLLFPFFALFLLQNALGPPFTSPVYSLGACTRVALSGCFSWHRAWGTSQVARTIWGWACVLALVLLIASQRSWRSPKLRHAESRGGWLKDLSLNQYQLCHEAWGIRQIIYLSRSWSHHRKSLPPRILCFIK